jgi:hypothetical protein
MEGVEPLFSLGQIVSTPGAFDALARASQQPDHFLNRHVTGDWGAAFRRMIKPKTNTACSIASAY